jgi:3-phosphoglycerate kinase
MAKQTITDDTRVRASIPTVKHLLSKGARVALSSHLGRPKVSHFSQLHSINCTLCDVRLPSVHQSLSSL